jgi:calcineurin-like phosphoesterase family protein
MINDGVDAIFVKVDHVTPRSYESESENESVFGYLHFCIFFSFFQIQIHTHTHNTQHTTTHNTQHTNTQVASFGLKPIHLGMSLSQV